MTSCLYLGKLKKPIQLGSSIGWDNFELGSCLIFNLSALLQRICAGSIVVTKFEGIISKGLWRRYSTQVNAGLANFFRKA